MYLLNVKCLAKIRDAGTSITLPIKTKRSNKSIKDSLRNCCLPIKSLHHRNFMQLPIRPSVSFGRKILCKNKSHGSIYTTDYFPRSLPPHILAHILGPHVVWNRIVRYFGLEENKEESYTFLFIFFFLNWIVVSAVNQSWPYRCVCLQPIS